MYIYGRELGLVLYCPQKKYTLKRSEGKFKWGVQIFDQELYKFVHMCLEK
jgi:hypothetical protein